MAERESGIGAGASHTSGPLARSMHSEPEHGPFAFSQDYEQRLRQLIRSPEQLAKAGYVVRQLSPTELERKKRCASCSKVLKARDKIQDTTQAPSFARRDSSQSQHPRTSSRNFTTDASARRSDTRKDGGQNAAGQDVLPEPDKAMNARCTFHPGKVAYRKWTCCDGHIMAKPCTKRENHSPRAYGRGELEENWKFFATPAPLPPGRRKSAVVIDCEMGNAASGESELIRVSVVDFFTREVLLDKLVSPRVQMAHYNTRYSGITRQMMENARRRRTCLDGREAAREAIWRFVGPETIVVGHGAQSDLTSLRWIHTLVIDTLMVEMNRRRAEREMAEAEKAMQAEDNGEPDSDDGGAALEAGDDNEPKPASQAEGGLSLKALALDRLNRVIQVRGQGHDSVEDAIATRDLLCWQVSHYTLLAD
ncbi:RNA exonuclease [Purpureocillium lilacinum]|uniref:RNA exonuclease n=1 Tax=Purpureocillium lilacinum TaxID=33203 RepID=A0A179HUH4_PURLI|nr:RNA exonuclease [Purpureocillium lilacinum]OAQ93089.1 RNA exonuclease [Purpureocillium lilacinum]PWI72527.1 hypothetical protein PCL_11150 [Purpureocillium lilacinum]